MEALNEMIRALLEESDGTAALANVSACIKEAMPGLNWAGFYLVRSGELVLGPFQGRVACTHIPFARGVCGACYRTKQAQRVDDVRTCQDHIACDAASRSELCVPVLIENEVVAEIDLDAPVPDFFTAADEKKMLQAAADLAEAWQHHHWKF
jgi:GAF domain-containing protein